MEGLAALDAYSSSDSGSEGQDEELSTGSRGIGDTADSISSEQTSNVGEKRTLTHDGGAVSKRLDCNSGEGHQGRVRSFPHVEGNYAGFVYIPVRGPEVEAAASRVVTWSRGVLAPRGITSIPNAELHLTLSRTFAVRRHHIDRLVRELGRQLKGLSSLSTSLRGVSMYCNDERTRTFVGLTVVPDATQTVQALVNVVDDALGRFSLPHYYERASFHVSVAWCLGPCPEPEPRAEEVPDVSVRLRATRVMAKIGAKTYSFPLKQSKGDGAAV